MSEPTIQLGYTPGARKCRCGTLIPPDWVVYRIASLPDSQQSLFHDQVFCSAKCLRAFCLETLETLAALDTPTSKQVVSDLHEVSLQLAQTIATILDRFA